MQNPNLQRPPPPPTQSVEEIQQLVQMARSVGPMQPSVVDAGQQRTVRGSSYALCSICCKARAHTPGALCFALLPRIKLVDGCHLVELGRCLLV